MNLKEFKRPTKLNDRVVEAIKIGVKADKSGNKVDLGMLTKELVKRKIKADETVED